eukprot:365717-Chlamydomonas_euryale.AAC.8
MRDNTLVAGGQGEVFFWDRRMPAAPVATLADTHMEDVTQVRLTTNARGCFLRSGKSLASESILLLFHDTRGSKFWTAPDTCRSPVTMTSLIAVFRNFKRPASRPIPRGIL